MDQSQQTWIANFIWGIADDVLRDVYVRGKYRDVILPMLVIHRLDAILEPTAQFTVVINFKIQFDVIAPVRAQPQTLHREIGAAHNGVFNAAMSDVIQLAMQKAGRLIEPISTLRFSQSAHSRATRF